MTAYFVGDIHLGKRFPYTNKKTAQRWEALKTKTLESILSLQGRKFQLGDLFDDFSVYHDVFMRGFLTAKGFEAVLSGNHDKSNNTEQKSALEALGQLGCRVVWDGVLCHENLVMVPHQLTQAEFEEKLDKAREVSNKDSILLLHCNYGDRPGKDTENYLRPEKAKELLEHFDCIVSGHEHNARTVLDNAYMVGSILPMNFGEMTTKYIGAYTPDDPIKLIEVWNPEGNYAKVPLEEFLALPIDTPLQFIEITGSVSLAESVLMSKRTVEWYMESGTLIAIKNSTTPYKTEVDATENIKAADWVSRVSDLMTEEQRSVFKELLERQDAR